MKKLLLPTWIIAGFCLLLYSFTQVDLSLTLSQEGTYQTVQKWFQYVGWFNRPLSTAFYLLVIGVLFSLYFITIKLVMAKKIDWNTIWKIVVCLSVILFLSYNAFSYDLFNYIFDAKIIAHYNQNPYLYKALDFPSDPMLSFMRWTHRTYPYGPVWLVLTTPLYYLGMGIFSITFYLFKALMVAAFIGSVILIRKIADKLNVDSTFCAAAFALNPLVLVESLVSAHNDIVMMFFGLLGLYLFLEKQHIASFVAFFISILIKFATVFILPAVVLKKILKLNNTVFLNILVLSMAGAVFVAVLSRSNLNPDSFNIQFQPWYLLYILPFTAFIQNKYYVAIPVFIISIAALFQYVPFLYIGNWDNPIPIVLN